MGRAIRKAVEKVMPCICLLAWSCLFFENALVGAAGEAFDKELSGAIGGKYAIRMTLHQDGSSVRGQLVYTKYGKPIKLEGTIDSEQNLVVKELDAGGKPTGIFRGRFVEPGRFSGTWSNPDDSKNMPFEVSGAPSSPPPKVEPSPSPPGSASEPTSRAPAPPPDPGPGLMHDPGAPVPLQQPQAPVSVPAPVTSAQIEEKKVPVKCPSKFEPATLTMPVVKGLDGSVQNKVQGALNLKSVLDTSVEELQTELNCWVDNVAFEVNFNRNSLLDISFTLTGTGAYTSSRTRNVVVSLKTGQRLKASDVFVSGTLSPLARKINETMQADILKTIQAVKKNNYDVERAFEGNVFEPPNLDAFSVGEKGLTFAYYFDFPQAIKSAEPKGRYFFSYDQLKSFIKPDGPLGPLVR